MLKFLVFFLSLFFILSCNDSVKGVGIQQKQDSDLISIENETIADTDKVVINDNQNDSDEVVVNDNQNDSDKVVVNDNQNDSDKVVVNDNQNDSDEVVVNDKDTTITDKDETTDNDIFVPECQKDSDCAQIDGIVCKSVKCENQKCVLKPLPKGTSCENGIFCDGKDKCDGNGKCLPTNISPCGNNACVEGTGCCDPGFAGENCNVCVRFVTPSSVKTPNGLTWHTAFTKIQDAIDNAEDNCEIWIKKGTYKESEIEPLNNIKILGGFAGNESLKTKRNWKQNKTIVDGDTQSSVFVLYKLSNTTIDGLIIQNGNAHSEIGDPASFNYGGGIYIDEAQQILLNHLEIAKNKAEEKGGGIYINKSDIIIRNSKILNNYSDYLGGGIALSNSDALLVNIVLSKNKTKKEGAGISISYSDTNIVNATIVFNELEHNSSYAGAGIHAYKSDNTILNTIVWKNNNGTEIGSRQSTLTVSYSDILGGHKGKYNIDSDPLFLSDDDLRLQKESPCIDIGQDQTKSNNVSLTDINGNKRYDVPGIGKTKTDIGAYEFILK